MASAQVIGAATSTHGQIGGALGWGGTQLCPGAWLWSGAGPPTSAESGWPSGAAQGADGG